VRREGLDSIRAALQRGELRLHYQPKVNLRTGQVIGAEALIRWQDPQRGLVPPAEFLPLVEGSELIADIGDWVLETALAQMASWQVAGLNLPVSINIAARHLQQGNFVPRLRECLSRHPEIPPGWLELEILESTALQDLTYARRIIEECRHLGVLFALDDFGTGYSSLAYLKNIPADRIKIDRSFVQDILEDADDLALVEGVVGLATAFKRSVIAEGMETHEHGLLLLRLGCDMAQGYGIARPMPAEDIPAWVAGYRPDPRWALWADVTWEMADFPLLMAQQDHQQWVRRVTGFLDGRALALSDQELTDQHCCRFGQWYYGQGRLRYGHMPEYAEVEAIHDAVHRVGPEIVRLFNAGQTEAARGRLPELLGLRDAILARLEILQRAVASRLARSP
jgi:EAL domain-containing protein (putative c-di-GMP-specific phosphodiesterase class I)